MGEKGLRIRSGVAEPFSRGKLLWDTELLHRALQRMIVLVLVLERDQSCGLSCR